MRLLRSELRYATTWVQASWKGCRIEEREGGVHLKGDLRSLYYDFEVSLACPREYSEP